MNKSFDIFLSHNSKDKPVVRELAEALRARGLRVWLDEWELVPGRPWQEALEEVIETTRSSAVLVGKDGIGPWQAPEMRGCLSEFVVRNLPVIPVLLPDAPEAPQLPLFLKQFTWVDLRKGLTKEGIDLIQWGVTSKKPDELPPENQNATEQGTSEYESMKKIRKIMAEFIPEFEQLFPGDLEAKIVKQLRESELFRIHTKRALVVGRTGAGKTTTINRLFEQEILPTVGKLTCTSCLACGEHRDGLILYDSPGIGDDEAAEDVARIACGLPQIGSPLVLLCHKP